MTAIVWKHVGRINCASDARRNSARGEPCQIYRCPAPRWGWLHVVYVTAERAMTWAPPPRTEPDLAMWEWPRSVRPCRRKYSVSGQQWPGRGRRDIPESRGAGRDAAGCPRVVFQFLVSSASPGRFLWTAGTRGPLRLRPSPFCIPCIVYISKTIHVNLTGRQRLVLSFSVCLCFFYWYRAE